MEPTYALNRSYWDSPADCLKQWLDAYSEIGKRHPELEETVKRLTARIRLADALFGGLANLGSTPDDTAYGERVEQGNKIYDEADALDGDFPLGDEYEVFVARYLFSIREMAYIQAGLAAELDPADISQVPRDKIFTIGDPRKFSDNELIQGRRDFLVKIAETHPITH